MIKLLFYCLIGMFYRKDIRIVNYAMCTFKYEGAVAEKIEPIYYVLPDDDLMSESIEEAVKRLLKDDSKSFKDRMNLSRILFSYKFKEKCKSNDRISHWMNDVLLADLWMGRKPEEVSISMYQSGKVLKFIKRYLMDYSLHIKHEINE